MPSIPPKLDDAFIKIRLGRVEEGMRLFDKVNGFETFKYAALAELACFRHDWKRFISFIQGYITTEDSIQWTSAAKYPRYSPYSSTDKLFSLLVLATCVLDCWKDTKAFFEQLLNEPKYNSTYGKKGDRYIYQIRSLLNDPKNTARKFLETKPHLKTERSEKGAKLIGYDIGSIRAVFSRHSYFIKRRGLGEADTYRRYFNNIISEGSTEDVIAVYKKYHNQLTDFDAHLSAAKRYIALDDLDGAKRAVANGVPYWEYYEPFQVAPLELFLDNELLPVMQDTRFSQSLLSIKRNNPAE